MIESWTVSGKQCIVTGATNGIGRVTALELARAGANVTIISRNEQRCKATKEMIREETGQTVEYIVADLSSQSDIRRAVEEYKAKHDKLHILINNAGAYIHEHTETADGIEKTFALNHLGYFLLTNLLLDTIKASAPARIISVSSLMHRYGNIDFDDIHSTRQYRGMKAYAMSKLANVLFTNELAERLNGTGVTANSLHPGIVNTGFGMGEDGKRTGVTVMNSMSISPEKGAQTSIFLATSPEVSGITGKYWSKKKQVSTSKAAQDVSARKRLWKISEEMTGLC